MEATIKEMTKKNIAKRLNIPHYFSSGSPYIMLGLKINSKGKRVK